MSDRFQFQLIPLPEHRLFCIRVNGDVTLKTLAKLETALRDHAEYTDGIDELFDYSSASFSSLRKSDIDLIHRFMVNNLEQQPCKSAIVVDSRVEYGIARMMAMTLAQDFPADRFVSYSLEEALRWLRPEHADELIAHLGNEV